MRSAIFIDGGYMRRLYRLYNETPFAYDKLCQIATEGTQLLRAYYYDCPPYVSSSPSPEQREKQRRWDGFNAQLNRIPNFDVKLGRLKKVPNGPDNKDEFVQKRVDIMLATDLVVHGVLGHIERAVLCTSDSDFVPVVEKVKEHGVNVQLYHHPQLPCLELSNSCDEKFEFTDEFIDRIRLV